MEQIKILVVDDESRMRKLVRDFLVKSGYHVLEAENGEDAIDIFMQNKDIALIVLDVMMPKMDGWEVCRELRKDSKVPIIMLTARGDERDELLGFELGVDEYITKPFSPKILVARIEAILRRTTGVDKADILQAGDIILD
nr:response regulator [Lachnospiraceae bacterium]